MDKFSILIRKPALHDLKFIPSSYAHRLLTDFGSLEAQGFHFIKIKKLKGTPFFEIKHKPLPYRSIFSVIGNTFYIHRVISKQAFDTALNNLKRNPPPLFT